MAFETIPNVKPTYNSSAPKTPRHGVTVTSRKAPSQAANGTHNRFIVLKIGPDLAKAVRFHADKQEVRLMFGTGSDSGKVGLAMQLGGGFVAKKQKSGNYALTINRLAAAGRFAMEFPAFTIDRIEAIRPENGQPPHFVFRATPEMLVSGE